MFSLRDISTAIQRFPLAIACYIILCITITTGIYNINLSFMLFFGGAFFIAERLYRESQNKLQLWFVAPIIFSAIAYYFYNGKILMTSFVFLNMAAISLIFTAPFIHKNDDELWTFWYRVSFHLMLSFLASWFLLGGISFILAMMDFLFNTDLILNTFFNTSSIIMFGIFPILFTSGIPKNFDEVQKNYPDFLKFTMYYIVFPLFAIFVGIIWVYVAKILMSGMEEKYRTKSIIFILHIASIMTYFISYPLHQNQKRIHYAFAIIMAVPIIFLGTLVSKEIYQYILTEHRYNILVFSIWGILSIGFMFGKNSLKRIGLSFAVVLLLTSIPPLQPKSFVKTINALYFKSEKK